MHTWPVFRNVFHVTAECRLPLQLPKAEASSQNAQAYKCLCGLYSKPRKIRISKFFETPHFKQIKSLRKPAQFKQITA